MLHSNYLKQLDLQDIVVFLNLLEQRSAKRTAELMNISQPTVSYCLKRLRGCFDDNLFTSLQGALLPTSKAAKIAPYLRVVVESVNRCAEEESGGGAAAVTKVWQVCAPEYFELSLLPRVLQSLAKAHASVSFHLERLGRDLPVDRMISGKVDIAIGFGPGYHQLHPELECCSILNDDFFCLTSYLGQGFRGGMSLDQFCASPHVYPTPWLSEKNMVDDWLGKIGRSRRVLVRANGYQSCVNILSEVPATLALPAKLLPLLRIPGNLVACEPPIGFPRFTLDMIWAKEHGQRQDVASLRGLIHGASGANLVLKEAHYKNFQ